MMDSRIPTTLRTPRLLLRPWRATDAEALQPILEANAAHLGPWIPAHVALPAPLPALKDRLAGFAADFAADRSFRFAILTGDESRLLGEADLFPRDAGERVPLACADRAELGYWLAANATGQGIATEAVGALFDVAATLRQMTHAEIRCDVANAPSGAVARRLGFHRTGIDAGLEIWRKSFRRRIPLSRLTSGGR